MLNDLRYAIRVLVKTPGFTAIAVATLALGIGANTAIFSVVNALLIRPLPYSQPDRLVMVWQDMRAKSGPATEWTTPANHFDWKAQKDVFEGVATLRGWNASLSGDGVPEAYLGEQTTYEYFDVLGIRPELGRVFLRTDDVPNAPRVVVLSHALWMQRFGGDRAVVGHVVSINGENHQIVGVMPASFRPVLVANAALWRPLRFNPANPSRGNVTNHTIGRLNRGVTLTYARNQLAALARRLEQEYPQSNTGVGINPMPLQEQQVGSVRRFALFVLLGAVGFVLLISCVNIANLLLARATGRTREIAVRRALGADRIRILRQLLTESVLLAALGGAFGVLVGLWGVSALKAIAPVGTPRFDEVGIDRVVLAFSAILALGTGLIFGLFPAWHAAGESVITALKHGGRGPAGDAGRARRFLVIGELALALVLLVAAGLLVRTFLALQRADLGFNPDHVLTGFVLPPPATYKTDAQRLAFYDAVLERTSALPGVKHAALSSVIPLGGDTDTDLLIEGRPIARTNADALVVWYRNVSANYFDAMGIRLRRGRFIAPHESAPVAVINETMANRHWPNEDPLGRRIRFDRDGPWFSIVGIVEDVRVRGPRAANEVEAYIGYWHNPEAGMNIVLKTAGEPRALAEPLKRAVKEVDRGIAVADIATMDQAIAETNGASRFYATLIAIFAVFALLLAAIGIYGVMSYAVSQRTPEIGVRLALGATERQVFALVVGESLRLAAVGLAIGIAGSIVVGRALQQLLFGVRAMDVGTFAATAALLVLVAFTASYLPARRAMRVDPMAALRIE